MIKAASRVAFEAAPTDGTLYLAVPTGQHALAIVKDYFGRVALPWTEPHRDMIAVPLARGRLQQLTHDLSALLTPQELRDCLTLVVGPGVEPAISDLPHTESLSTLVGRVQGEWLVELLQEDRLVTHYQPILPCRLPGEVFAYESLLRGVDHDGTLIPPSVILDVAKSAELLADLDRAARFAAIRGAVEHKLASKLFINFIPTAIYDPAYGLSTTVLEIERSEIDPSRVVFEVVESEHVPDIDRLLRILDFYRDAGFLVALDDLGAGYSSLTLLTRLKPDFVKLDTELVRNVDADPYKANIALKLLELARSLGIKTIAEGVETRSEWLWLTEHDCDYVQGFFFGKPAASPEPYGGSLVRAVSPARPAPVVRAPSPARPAALDRPLVAARGSVEVAPVSDRDDEVRRLREKVGELVMELESLKRAIPAGAAGPAGRGVR
jgi:EAL domain-containing protein (putative c-di-GMP-specific phosphodiesterase class I)